MEPSRKKECNFKRDRNYTSDCIGSTQSLLQQTEEDFAIKDFLSQDFEIQQKMINNNKNLLSFKQSNSHNSILHLCVINDKFQLAKYILQNEGDPNIQNKKMETPLHKAVENCNHKMINLLLDNNADPNITQEKGETAMHIAVNKGDYKVIKLLLLYKADINIVTNEGLTVEDYAIEKGEQKCIEVLGKAKMNSNNILKTGTSKNNLNFSKDMPFLEQQKTEDEIVPNGMEMNEMFKMKGHSVEIFKSNTKRISMQTPITYKEPFDLMSFSFKNKDLLNKTPDKNNYNNSNINNKSSSNKSNNNSSNNSNNSHNNNNNNISKIFSHKNSNNNINNIFSHNNSNNNINNLSFYENLINNEDTSLDQHQKPFTFNILHTKLNTNSNIFTFYHNNNNNSNNTLSFIDNSLPIKVNQSKKNDIIKECLIRELTRNSFIKRNNTLRTSIFFKSNILSEEFGQQQKQLSKISSNSISKSAITDKENEIWNYLYEIHLTEYEEILVNEGYDNIELMKAQMQSPKPINDEDLKKIGIKIAGHRAMILIKLQMDSDTFRLNYNEHLDLKKVFYKSYFSINNYESDEHLNEVYKWLSEIKLNEFFKNFYDSGYHSKELLMMQMISKNPLNDDILKNDLKIDKYGYRSRILSKLSEDSSIFRMFYKVSTTKNSILDIENSNEGNRISCNCSIF